MEKLGIVILFLCVFLWSSVALAEALICPVRIHDSQQLWADGAWRGASAQADGSILLGFCTHSIDRHARVLRYDPKRGQFAILADIGNVIPKPAVPAIPQGKIHTPFHRINAHVYFSTSIGPVINKTLSLRAPYPGGYFIRHDPAANTFNVLAQAPEGEALITLDADPKRERLFAVTYPKGRFLVVDVPTASVRDMGGTDAEWFGGEKRARYVEACRHLAVDPETGRVFGSRKDGTVYMWDPEDNQLKDSPLNVRSGAAIPLSEESAKWSMWRAVVYDSLDKVFYGMHRGSASLFRFDPAAMTITPVAPIAPAVGASSSKSVARLGMVLGRGRVIWQVVHGPALTVDGRERQARYQTHLVGYDLKTKKLIHRGALMAGDRRVVHCDTLTEIADGTLFALAFVELTDPIRLWRLKHETRGPGSYHTVGGVYFEMALIEISQRP